MKIIKDSIQALNPGQTPVVTVDQPLLAIAKAIQWSPESSFNENNFFVNMGALHIEMLLETWQH